MRQVFTHVVRMFTFLVITFIYLNTADAKTPIYCPDTKELLYYWAFDVVDAKADAQIKAEDFTPIDGVPSPSPNDPMVCPGTDTPLNGFEFVANRHGINMRMVYPVVSLLTKTDSGEFVWFPFSEEDIYNTLGLPNPHDTDPRAERGQTVSEEPTQ